MRHLTALLVLSAAALAAPIDNLPGDCPVAVHLDLARLSKTTLWKLAEPLLADAIGDDDYRALSEKTGIKLADLASLTIGISGDDLDDPDVYVCVHGKVDPAKMESFLKDVGEYTVTKKDDMTLFIPKETDESPEVAVAADAMFLASARGGLEKLLAAGKADAPRAPIAKLLDGTEAMQVSCAILGTPEVRKSLKEDPDCAFLASFTSMIFRVDVGEKLKVDVDCKSGDDGTGLKPGPGEEGNCFSCKLVLPLESAMPLLVDILDMGGDEGGPGGEPEDDEGEPFGEER